MSKVDFSKEGNVGYVTLNRPEVMNAIDREMVSLLDSVWEECEADEDIWVVVLTGAGGNFCSGYDVKAINERQKSGIPYDWSRSSMFGSQRIGPDGHNLSKPLIAALDGNVNGAGVWLALQSDIKVSTEKAKFALGEARFNFPVEFSAFICKYLPRAVAAEMLFGLKTFSGKRLYDLGVINEIVEEKELLESADMIAKKLTKRGPLCISAMKKLLNYDPEHGEMISITAETIVPIVNSEDTKEAVRAYVEKRKPNWKLR